MDDPARVLGPRGDQKDGAQARERLAKLAHDLRTPLAIVAGFTELLVDNDARLSPAQRADYLARMQAACGEMRDMLDQERDERHTEK